MASRTSCEDDSRMFLSIGVATWAGMLVGARHARAGNGAVVD